MSTRSVRVRGRILSGFIFPVSWIGARIWALVRDLAGPSWHIPFDLALLALGGALLAYRIRHTRVDPGEILRDRLLAQAKRIGPRELWLNRGEHRVFACTRRPGAYRLTVMEEDLAQEILESGQGVFSDITYIIVPSLIGGIIRHVDGTRVRVEGPEDVVDVDAGRNRLMPRLWRALKMLRPAFLGSMMVPDRTELQQVIAWAQGAERLTDIR